MPTYTDICSEVYIIMNLAAYCQIILNRIGGWNFGHLYVMICLDNIPDKWDACAAVKLFILQIMSCWWRHNFVIHVFFNGCLTFAVIAMRSLKESLKVPDRMGWNGDPCAPTSWDAWEGVTCHTNKGESALVVSQM